MRKPKESDPKRSLLGPDKRRLQPKLRMVANGSNTVNTLRAELAGAVKITTLSQTRGVSIRRGSGCVPYSKATLPKAHGKPAKRGHLPKLPDSVATSVFIYTTTPKRLKTSIAAERGRKGRITKAIVTASDLPKLAKAPEIAYVELGQPLRAPTPIITATTGARGPAARTDILHVDRHHAGKDVLIGIIDVQGFDFSHPDFLDGQGRTRWVSIWDQGGDARPSPRGSEQFAYGAEFTQEMLNAALKASKRLKVAAYELERQSQRVPGSHGTHVASIAAGTLGVCPQAYLAGVLIDLPRGDVDRRRSFYDSTRIADAVDYLVRLQDELSERRGRRVGLSINISLGTNGHAHDTSSAINRWIDAVLNEPGRCVTVAAGNAGQARADDPGDAGWVLGQIHTSGRIDKAGLDVDLEWVVVGNGLLDISENELELWFSAQDRLAVSVRPPGSGWLEPVEPGSFIENRRLDDGSFISIYNERYHPANGCNYVAIYLSPMMTKDGVIGVPAGTWQVRLHGREIRDGRFHGWIERDDPIKIGAVGPREAWRFPSFFSDRSNVDNSSISSLACAERVVAVANLDERGDRITISSSQGPTRDGRPKPDVAAPGTDIVAAKGFSGPNDLWIGMTGTSMAAPYVAGVAGLMLAVEPQLTGAQIVGIMHRTARPLPGVDFSWQNNGGFGRVSLAGCLEEARSINERTDRTSQ